ncbi:hypothetical protein [Mucilaginibacter sp. 10B2]|uniref:hypothetical protein n=1 Tax=Mucilaginibacter sp. 10B2 TaxID=3048574 RepID=UPI002B22A7E5|nr:hypothetical protein [Mucilaginibacter sp. 10B2]MEB0278966.1 hypothetical protein [Mucilaginibacter sp. 10B2]
MIVKHLELKNQSYKNIKLNGLSVKCLLNGLANAGSTNVDFSKSNLKIILTRNDVQHVIVMDNLKILGLASSIDLLNQQSFATNTPMGEQLVTGQTALVNFTIPFGGVIDLHGDDEIYIEVQNSSSLFTDPALEAASYIEIKPIKCYGVERFIPSIRTWVIQANEQSNQYMIGDNLIRLVMLNYDKTDFKNNVINNLIFSSDRLDETYTFADLVANKLSGFGKQLLPHADADIAVDIQQDQSFVITDFHQEYDGVQLDMQFNAPNLTASNNYIVAWTYKTDWTILTKAAESDKKHENVALAKINAVSIKK